MSQEVLLTEYLKLINWKSHELQANLSMDLSMSEHASMSNRPSTRKVYERHAISSSCPRVAGSKLETPGMATHKNNAIYVEVLPPRAMLSFNALL